MSRTPRFTVVIPTRERARTLHFTLRTCLAQAFDDFEVLVSDNQSPDGGARDRPSARGAGAFGHVCGGGRYTSLPELLRLLRGTTLGVGPTVLYFVFTTRFEGLSRAVFVLDWLLLTVLLSASRVSFRVLGEVLRPSRGDFRRVLIYGAGDGGELMLRELRNNVDLRREAVGFLDDDRSKVGTRIHEVPVLGGLDQVEDLLPVHGIAEVIVSSAKIPAEQVRRLEAICAARGVAVVRGAVRLE